jgi:hypothetical protein
MAGLPHQGQQIREIRRCDPSHTREEAPGFPLQAALPSLALSCCWQPNQVNYVILGRSYPREVGADQPAT